MQDRDVKDIVNAKIAEMGKKADHNKFESLWGFKLIMFTSMLAPILIAFGPGLFLGKIAPVILSLLAAGFTAWIQLRKPHNLWRIYRTGQRKMEIELDSYMFSIDEYDIDNLERDKVLIKKVNEIYLTTHSQWSEQIPSSEDVHMLSNKEV